jgi:prepilin-type N-terminal cleavage/methylation domain-containing protein
MTPRIEPRTKGQGPRTRRAPAPRGVTLIEMLVTVAILVIVMAVVAQVFSAATGAMSAAQAVMDLDGQLRRLESVIRTDLGGATASFTPAPNYPAGPFGCDPSQNQGYFEYGENEFADNQGEDSDDYIKFTAKAPLGQPFTGRMFLPPPQGFGNMNQTQISNYLATQPITITSDYAEIIYFLRNGNLYRRVLLIAPQLQPSVYQVANNEDTAQTGANAYGSNTPAPADVPFTPAAFGNPTTAAFSGVMPISWLGVNDLSARPQARGLGNPTIVLNSLGDLSNRENRFAAPRFADDFYSLITAGPGADGLADDRNDDNVNDYYPSLYFGVFNLTGANQLIWEPGFPNVPRNAASFETMAFPYIFPGAYSQPQNLANGYQLGWIHSPDPVSGGVTYDSNPSVYLQSLNHNPIDVGDNLPTPATLPSTAYQTWWGFPTWRETLSYNWNDPTWQVNIGFLNAGIAQPNGLSPRPPTTVPVPYGDPNLLPAMNSLWRGIPQLYTPIPNSTGDAGGLTMFFPQPANNAQLWQLWSKVSWEDDLIMTNVRSFDVKAYDNSLAGYADLGWGDDPRMTSQLIPANFGINNQAPFLAGNPDFSGNNYYPPPLFVNGQWCNDYINLTFAHEGRMPPLVEDNRLDTQVNANNITPTYYHSFNTFSPPISGYQNYSSNVGDDQPGVVRLRRVWDSWSTEYSQAPASGQFINAATGIASATGLPFTPPIYPSYPPPYPAQLRAIQIQIRVADPASQHVKSITIREDFTEKL